MERPCFNCYSFFEYPPDEIFKKDCYKNSLKNLSFQYRDKKSDELLCYVSLKKERAPISIPELRDDDMEYGCRILMVDARRIITRDNWTIIDTQYLYSAFDEMEFRITSWCDTSTNEIAFRYFWCDIRDFNEKELLDRIGEMKQKGNIFYKVIDRKGQAN